MKLFIRELPQKQYHHNVTFSLPKNITPKPHDVYYDHWYNYHIDYIVYGKNDLHVYMTATKLDKLRLNTTYKKYKPPKEKLK